MEKNKLRPSEDKCEACTSHEQPLGNVEISELLAKAPGWTLANEGRFLFREYVMKDFMHAVAFIQQVAFLAETEGHHPDIHLTNYKKLRIELFTRKIGGVSRNDLILAAKIDQIPLSKESLLDILRDRGSDFVSKIPGSEELGNAIEKQIDEWQVRLQMIKDKAYAVEVKSRVAYENQLRAICDRILEAQKKLSEIRSANSDRWHTVAEESHEKWHKLKHSIEQAFEKLKNKNG